MPWYRYRLHTDPAGLQSLPSIPDRDTVPRNGSSPSVQGASSVLSCRFLQCSNFYLEIGNRAFQILGSRNQPIFTYLFQGNFSFSQILPELLTHFIYRKGTVHQGFFQAPDTDGKGRD